MRKVLTNGPFKGYRDINGMVILAKVFTSGSFDYRSIVKELQLYCGSNDFMYRDLDAGWLTTVYVRVKSGSGKHDFFKNVMNFVEIE